MYLYLQHETASISFAFRSTRADLRFFRRPFVDFARGLAHQLGAVTLGQPVSHAERVDTLFVGQQFDRAGPVGAPQATVQGECSKDAAERFPDVLIGKWVMR